MSDNTALVLVLAVLFMSMAYAMRGCNEQFEETRRLRITTEASDE